MKYWSKYLVVDRVDEDTVIWSSLLSRGCLIKDPDKKIYESVKSGKWDESIDPSIKMNIEKREFILEEEQLRAEHKLIAKIRSEIVFDDSFMSLTLIPTDTCNFRCIYCYQSDTVHNMSYQVADSIVKMISAKSNLKHLHISWFGGEPLCNKKMVFYLMEEINKVCKKNGVVLVADMTTNASLLDFDTFMKLYSLRVLHYQVTIDGCKSTHDLQRPLASGGSSFELIMKNLRSIRDNVKGKLFRIGIRTNFTPDVDKNFDELKRILIEEFSGDKRFYFFFQWVKNWGGERIKGLKNELMDDEKAISKYGRWMDVMSQTDVRTGDITMIRACSGLCVGSRKNSYLVNYDGKLHKCTTCIYDDEYHDKSEIGYIDSNGRVIIDKWKEIDWISCDADMNVCTKCNMYPICLGMPCPYFKIKLKKITCNRNDTYLRFMLRALARQGYIESISI